MTASSLYRQWRPDRFDEVVGQEHVVTTLKNAIVRDQVGHAYIFAGPRGTGKTTIARLLAKSVNCVGESRDPAEPCNECEACLDVSSQSSMNVVEMDAASHRGIDDIRELQERVSYANPRGRFRIYILDEAHMLTPEAFNALLKTLEEPPAHVIFILCTTEPHKIPVTIQSRCQRFDFRFLTVLEIMERLKHIVAADDSLEVDEAALWSIAVSADGAVRDALGLLEQCRDYAGGRISEKDVRTVTGAVSRRTLFDYAELMRQNDVGGLLQLVEDVVLSGADIGQFIRELLGFFRDMLLLRASAGKRKPIIPEDDLNEMADVADGYDIERLLDIVDVLADTESRARYVSRPAFLLEMSTIRLAGSSGVLTPSDESSETTGVEAGGVEHYEPARVDAPQTERETTDDRPAQRISDPAESEHETKEEESADSGTKSASSSDPATPGDVPFGESEWEKAKELVRGANMPAYALLQPARPGPRRGEAVMLVFQDGFTYHKERTEKENCSLVERAISRVLGEEVRIRCVFESEVDSPSGAPGIAEFPSTAVGDDANEGEVSVPEQSGARRDEVNAGESAPSPAANDSDEDDNLADLIDAFDGKVVGKIDDMGGPTPEER
ncbi:MAG: DNA polymerase III subunit gamma/tau [Bacillota bacterium]